MRYLLIDTSYFVFFRYFALISYMKLRKTDFNANEFTMDDAFVQQFSNLFEKCLLTLLKQHFGIVRKKFENVTVIFALDCFRSSIWRLELFSEYKANRDIHRPNDLFDGRIFEHVHNQLLPQLMKKYPFIRVVCHPRAEADDIVAITVKYFKEECVFKCEQSVIITNDHDYLQLLDIVDSMYNLQGKNLETKRLSGCAEKNMLSKVLVGDPSDNIKGIFTKQKANKLLSKYDDVESIEKEIVELASEEQLRTYYLNKALICFDNIPDDICVYVRENVYNQILNKSNA